MQHATDKAYKKWQQNYSLTSSDEVTEKVLYHFVLSWLFLPRPSCSSLVLLSFVWSGTMMMQLRYRCLLSNNQECTTMRNNYWSCLIHHYQSLFLPCLSLQWALLSPCCSHRFSLSLSQYTKHMTRTPCSRTSGSSSTRASPPTPSPTPRRPRPSSAASRVCSSRATSSPSPTL